MSLQINGISGYEPGRMNIGPTGKKNGELTQREHNPQDFFSIGDTGDTNHIIPVSALKSAVGIQKSALTDTVESEKYINALDAAAPMLPAAVNAVLNPTDKDSSFAQLVRDTKPGTPFNGDPSRSMDPEGDAHLIRRLDTVPVKLTKALLQAFKNVISGKGFKDSPGAVKEPVNIGREKPVKVDALINKFIEIIQETPDIKPFIGEEHKWSPQAKKYNRFGFFRRLGGFITGKQGPPAPLLGRSKLFLSLACGWTRDYLPTGKEDRLEQHLMKFKDKSVRFEDVFRESYRLNEGDLYRTLLTAENVLANNVYSENRDQQPLQQKLEYIRNDSEPRGDNFGAWYHFMGASLYGLVRSETAAKAVVLTEALGSFFLEGPDRQETHINVAGAEFGSGLRKMINEEAWKKPLPPLADIAYMNLNEFPAK